MFIACRRAVLVSLLCAGIAAGCSDGSPTDGSNPEFYLRLRLNGREWTPAEDPLFDFNAFSTGILHYRGERILKFQAHNTPEKQFFEWNIPAPESVGEYLIQRAHYDGPRPQNVVRHE